MAFTSKDKLKTCRQTRAELNPGTHTILKKKKNRPKGNYPGRNEMLLNGNLDVLKGMKSIKNNHLEAQTQHMLIEDIKLRIPCCGIISVAAAYTPVSRDRAGSWVSCFISHSACC